MSQTLLKSFFLCSLYALWGCTPSVAPQLFLSPSFISDSVPAVTQASGKISIKNGDSRQSGDLLLTIDNEHQLRMRILAPLLGSQLYEIRMNDEQMMILDYQHREYFLGENTPSVRKIWLGVDLRMAEVGWWIWGRISSRQFEEWSGHKTTSGVILTKEQETYEIEFRDNQLPYKIIKKENQITIFEITIMEYQNIDHFRVPYKINILDLQENNQLRIVLTELSASSETLNLDFDPPASMRPLVTAFGDDS
ncbi:MAG: DUF4292 domain-containing protein [SAR324 cluster bacterium]|nr:DUF4292 domain-containing protein [SAR324 cluster bacterium]